MDSDSRRSDATRTRTGTVLNGVSLPLEYRPILCDSLARCLAPRVQTNLGVATSKQVAQSLATRQRSDRCLDHAASAGFEPAEVLPSLGFKASAIAHSANSPLGGPASGPSTILCGQRGLAPRLVKASAFPYCAVTELLILYTRKCCDSNADGREPLPPFQDGPFPFGSLPDPPYAHSRGHAARKMDLLLLAIRSPLVRGEPETRTLTGFHPWRCSKPPAFHSLTRQDRHNRTSPQRQGIQPCWLCRRCPIEELNL